MKKGMKEMKAMKDSYSDLRLEFPKMMQKEKAKK